MGISFLHDGPASRDGSPEGAREAAREASGSAPDRLRPASAAGLRLLLAHGAGAPMDSPFMDAIAKALGARGIAVTRFEFPYMQARRQSEKKRGPDPQAVLLECYRDAVRTLGDERRLFIGGKSMGGRMASMIADELRVRGLICLGYPFHPAGKPEQTRVAHLASLHTPTLIVQGTRDTLGSRDDVLGYAMSPAIRVAWIEDGDHNLSPRKRSGRTDSQTMDEAVHAVTTFMESIG